jgi:hypothetical protein
VWVAQIPADATYDITTDGQVNGYITPQLAFGHSSSYGYLVWVFVAIFVAGLAISILAGMWLGRTRRKAVVSAYPPPAFSPVEVQPSYAAPVSSGEGIRLERLKTLASLRDSGALTEEEFQAEKSRILGGG